MSKRLTDQVQRALALLPLPRYSEGIGKGYSTIQAYMYGRREPTAAAAREIAAYLRSQADEFTEVADALDSAADAEEDQ